MTNRSDRSYPAFPLLAVSAAIWSGDKVLLTRRAKKPAKGLWSLPGGLVHAGETLAEAAQRELDEEAGISACLDRVADWAEVIVRDGAGDVSTHYVIAMFVGTWISGALRAGDDADEAQWFSPQQFDEIEMTPGTAERILRHKPA